MSSLKTHGRTSSVTPMLNKLKLPPLQHRRQFNSLVMFHKTINRYVDLDINNFLSLQEPPATRTRMVTRSCKVNQLVIPQSNSQPHLYSFFPQMARTWNSLPEEVTTSNSTNSFKTALQKHMQLE